MCAPRVNGEAWAVWGNPKNRMRLKRLMLAIRPNPRDEITP
jgi:hypothetical protein